MPSPSVPCCNAQYNWRQRAAGARDLRRHALTGLLHGLVWAACMTLFQGEKPSIWWRSGPSSAASWCGAISYAATPLAAIAFLVPCIVGLSAMFDGGTLLRRALATSYALSLLVGCSIYARTFARQHSTTVQLAEQTEVVSLLLREYEQELPTGCGRPMRCAGSAAYPSVSPKASA